MAKKVNARLRNYNLLVYDERLKDVVESVKDMTNRGIIRTYYFCRHQPEQDKLQYHTHFVIEFYNCKTVTAVAKNFELEDRFVEPCNSVRSSVCYLIHKYEKNKIRYNDIDIETNDRERTFMFLNAPNDNVANDYFQFFHRCVHIIKCNQKKRWCDIFDIIINDKDLDPKFIPRSNGPLYKYWESFNFGVDFSSYEDYQDIKNSAIGHCTNPLGKADDLGG